MAAATWRADEDKTAIRKRQAGSFVCADDGGSDCDEEEEYSKPIRLFVRLIFVVVAKDRSFIHSKY